VEGTVLANPYRKIGRKKGRKKGSEKIGIFKKFFLGKTQKGMVFIFEKLNWRVGVYFSGAI